MIRLPYPFVWFLRLIAAAVLTFLLLTGVSLLHAAMGFGSAGEKKSVERRIVAQEIVRKQPEEKKTERQRVRQVKTSNQEGKSDQGRMTMRFSPDLAVDAAGGGDGAEIALAKQELGAEIFNQGQTDEGAVGEFTEVNFSDRARDQGIEGDIEVLFVVTHTGKATALEFRRCPSPLLAAEVRRAAAAWKFKPAKNKGIPVNQRYTITIRYKLK